MEEITPEQALEIYKCGVDAVVKVICELSKRTTYPLKNYRQNWEI
jgi:hypothetical protein